MNGEFQSDVKMDVVNHLLYNKYEFCCSGSYMYSGGGEGVMVRWSVEVSNVRNFLPRLPAPILHLTVSPDNQYVAIATQDNGEINNSIFIHVIMYICVIYNVA